MRIIGYCCCGYEIDSDDDYIEIHDGDMTSYLCSWNCSVHFIKQNLDYKEVC